MGMKYFTADIRNVKIDGVEVKNALIVSGIQDGLEQPDLTYVIPEAYRGADIMGCRYIPETQTFEQVDPEQTPEPTPDKTMATKADIARVEEQNFILMEGLVDLFDVMLGGGM